MVGKRKLPADIIDVQQVMASLCDKWSLRILHHLSQGTKRHGELHRAIHGISQKMLTQTLRRLERDRLVQRTVYPMVPPRVDYALTRLGSSLTVPLHVLYRWTEAHLAEIRRARHGAREPCHGTQSAQPAGPEHESVVGGLERRRRDVAAARQEKSAL